MRSGLVTKIIASTIITRLNDHGIAVNEVNGVRAYLRLDVCEEQWRQTVAARTHKSTKLVLAADIEALCARRDEEEKICTSPSSH